MRSLALLVMLTVSLARIPGQNCNLICNGGFDDYFLTNSVGLFTTIACWSTTATDGNMEVWGTGFNGVPSYSGSTQHVELNATQGASMYQNFPVTSGTTYTVCFAHRGRAGVDSMSVSVGPSPNGPFVSLGKFGDGTSAWGYYCVTFTATSTGMYRVMFTPFYWSGGNPAIGNFIDAVSVTGPASVSVTVSSPSICSGGTSTLSVTGATSYTWSTSSTASAIAVSPQVTTTYTLRAVAGTCTSVVTRTVFVFSSALSASGNTVCAGTPVILSASGAQSYTWTPGSFSGPTLSISNPQSTAVFTLNALSAQGCTATAMVTLSVIPVPVISFSVNPGTCASAGGATVQASGGVGPYNYNWTPGMIIGPVSGNLGSGTYTVYTVDQGSGCTKASTVFIPPVTPSLVAGGGTVCTGETISLTASSQSGVTYTWTGPNSFYSNQQNPQITSASLAHSGNYTVSISSANGCTNTAVIHAKVTDPPVLSAALSSSVACNQAFNGSVNSITLFPSGADTYTVIPPGGIQCVALGGTLFSFALVAIPPYQPQITVNTATLYGALNGGCAASLPVTFTIIPNPTVGVTTSTNTICAGEQFTYTASGAQNYVWTQPIPGTAFFSNNSVGVSAPVQSASFSVYGIENGCNSANATGSITVIPVPTLEILPKSARACAGSPVTLTVQGNALTYNWEPASDLNVASGTVVIASTQNNSTYTVTGLVYHCRNSAVSEVSIVPLPVATASFARPRICPGEKALLAGGGGLEYLWSTPDHQSLTGKNVSFQVTGMQQAGLYTLTVTGENNCKNTATALLELHPLPDGYLASAQWTGCAPLCTPFGFKGRSAAITSTWTIGNRKFPGETFSHCFSTPGIHTVTGVIIDTLTGCRAAQAYTVEAFAPPVADFLWNPEETVEIYTPVQFTNQSIGERQVSWRWSFSHDHEFGPDTQSFTYEFAEAGRYVIAMVVKNEWGCADTAVRFIDVQEDFAVYVPDAFTPNGDDRNDVFRAVARGLKQYRLSIYDRWGHCLYTGTELPEGWDGTSEGQPCKSGVYTWQIVLTTGRGEPRELIGKVSLIR